MRPYSWRANPFVFHRRPPPNDSSSSAYEPPINCLPPEVLAEILQVRGLDQDLVVATHVCRYWRSALVSTPCLWTRIPCYDVDCASTYLERSKSAPIDVLAVKTRFSSPIDSALELVIPHLGRVRSIMIHTAPDEPLQAIFLFRSPAPLLRRLEISGYARGQISQLPGDFLGCHVPLLRFLQWRDSLSTRSSVSLPNPTHLWLDDVDGVPAPLCVILGLTSCAPHLQHLYITILDVGLGLDSTPVHDIHLGSLRCLELASGAGLSRVIPHLKVPQLKELSLTLPFSEEAPTIANLLPSDSYPLITEVTSMEFSAGGGNIETNLEGEGTRVVVNAFITRVEDINDFFSDMSHTTSFSFAQITRLKLRLMVGSLATRIGEFTNLELLELAYCEEDMEVLFALSPSLQPVSRIPCPCLVEMRVHFYHSTAYAADSLKQMVRSRKEAGNPLVTVDLVSSYCGGEWIDTDEWGEWLGPTPVLE